jgi:hypothetical protein
MSEIILLSDVKEQRARKHAELVFYLTKKAELETKLEYLRADIRLTDHIIKLIEKEQITEVRPE